MSGSVIATAPLPMHKVFLIGFLIALACTGYGQNAKWKNWEAQGDTLLQQGDYKGAIKFYSRIIKASKKLDQDGYQVLYKRAICFYSSGDFPNALKDLDQFLEAYAHIPQPRMLRALTYKELGDTEKQMQDLDGALASDPGNVDLLKWRATLYLEEEAYELAKKDAELARLLQDDAEIEVYLGIAYYNLEQTDSALLSINQAIAQNATYLPAYMYGASFCLGEERYSKALEYLDLALRLDPQNLSATFYRGVALVELEKTTEGCRCLRKAFYSGLDDASDYLTEFCYGSER